MHHKHQDFLHGYIKFYFCALDDKGSFIKSPGKSGNFETMIQWQLTPHLEEQDYMDDDLDCDLDCDVYHNLEDIPIHTATVSGWLSR